MAIEQPHEQANALIKGDGGAIGLKETPTELKRWMVDGPVISRMVDQYENISDVKQGSLNEDNQTTQKCFGKEFHTLLSVIQNMGNLFNESSKDLWILSSRNIVQASKSINEIVAQGHEPFKTFERFIDRGIQKSHPKK